MKVQIPPSFQCPPFYQQSFLEDNEENSFSENIRKYLFYYELTNNLQPWQNKEYYVPILFELWKQQEMFLSIYFRARNLQATKKPMLHMIALLMNVLFWTNNQPVPSLYHVAKEASRLHFKPVNIQDRLSFLLSGPNRYQSFIQLKALLGEAEKIFAKAIILEKNK
ncbi:YpoC family protein [Bacillus solitudinis]|uniref:YpoC family protein n=1 Tax=Bacillus solitudinis TaxID=2014074 RepID=UPI000C242270|nr:hypothetical protein [Bacillus solitudinis]